MLRRDLLTGGPAAPALTATGRLVGAQDNYPSRTVRLIVPTAAGGVYDLMGRLFMDGSALPRHRDVENAPAAMPGRRDGGGEGCARRLYALLGSNSTHIVQPVMMRNPPYDPVKQFVAGVDAVGGVVLHRGRAQTRRQHARRAHRLRPQEPRQAHGRHRGIGNSSHMSAELLKKLAPGFTMQYIPYSAMAQAVRDLITGDLDMTATLITRSLVELHEAGKIKLLAVMPPAVDVAPDNADRDRGGHPQHGRRAVLLPVRAGRHAERRSSRTQRPLARRADRRDLQKPSSKAPASIRSSLRGTRAETRKISIPKPGALALW